MFLILNINNNKYKFIHIFTQNITCFRLNSFPALMFSMGANIKCN